MIQSIKQVVENYINSRQMTAILSGTFKDGHVILNEKAYIPSSLLTGNLRSALRQGDKVKLLRNDKGTEYYILEITGASVRLQREEIHEDIQP